MRNFNIGVGMDEEPIHHTEFEKAVDLIGLIVVEEDKLVSFMDALKGLETKALCGVISTEEADALDKGKKDLSKLVKKKVTDKTGKVTTKWVKAGEDPNKDAKGGKESGDKKPAGKNVEKHAEDTRTHKLEKYVKEGKDDKLKQIAKDELRKRKSEESKKKYADAQTAQKKEKEEKDAGHVLGKTKSGKFVFHEHEGGGHEGFTEQDHKDAHSMHTKQADDTRNSPKTRDKHRNEASIHAKEANKKMVAGMAEKANPKGGSEVKALSDIMSAYPDYFPKFDENTGKKKSYKLSKDMGADDDDMWHIDGTEDDESEDSGLYLVKDKYEDHEWAIENGTGDLVEGLEKLKEGKTASPKKVEPKGFQHHDDMAEFHKDQSKYSEGSMKKFHDKMENYHKGGSLSSSEHEKAAKYHSGIVEMDKNSANREGEKYEKTIHDSAVEHHTKLSKKK